MSQRDIFYTGFAPPWGKETKSTNFLELLRWTTATWAEQRATDEACPPQAAGRMRDVEFVPTQLPPFAILSFDRQRRFLSHTRKKAPLKPCRIMLFAAQRKRGLNVSGPARDFLSEAGARLKAYRVYVEAEQRTSGRKDPSWDHMKAKIAFTHRYVI